VSAQFQPEESAVCKLWGNLIILYMIMF